MTADAPLCEDAARSRPRAPLGHLTVDCVTQDQALERIAAFVGARRSATVFTPNLDHFVLAERDPAFLGAYQAADLVLVDGMAVLWSFRLLGWPVPAKVSGSDLVDPLAARAAAEGWRVYLLGASPSVAELAAGRWRERHPTLRIVGIDSPWIDLSRPIEERAEALARCRAAQPDLVLVALGTPKGETYAQELRQGLPAAVIVSVGASLDFITGTVRRAPRWVQRMGCEWLFRLLREPRRLWRRYLVRDAAFLPILMRALATQRAPRRASLPSGGA